MKLLKKRITIGIVIFIVILLVLFIFLFDSMSAEILEVSVQRISNSIIQDNNNKEHIIFSVNISGSEYYFSSSHIIFLNNDNKIIKPNDFMSGDKIFILKLNWIERDLASNPPEIQNIFLVKKLNGQSVF